ncbi:hypothetical protein RIF29_13497 [Crotalaria pallida]|uniref:Uncharacterized protein n=1 Tax=Crotalaria pallida TaxID=3830 RepID=A0AAN9IPH0_CROPI
MQSGSIYFLHLLIYFSFGKLPLPFPFKNLEFIFCLEDLRKSFTTLKYSLLISFQELKGFLQHRPVTIRIAKMGHVDIAFPCDNVRCDLATP